MPEETFCRDCPDKNRCESAYRIMGKSNGEGVLRGCAVRVCCEGVLRVSVRVCCEGVCEGVL